MLKREYGKEQPYIPAGIFKIRIPFVHFGISVPEALNGLSNTIASLVAVATLMSVLGIDVATGRAVIVISSACYLLNWLLGDPCIGGWITPAIAVTTMFLNGFEMGIDRNQAMCALQLLVAGIFLIMGITGLARKIVAFVPPSMKAGIIMGAAVAAVFSQFGESGNFTRAPMTVSIGICIAFFLLYGLRFKKLALTNPVAKFLSKFTFPVAVFATMIVGGLIGEIHYVPLTLDPLISLPDFVGAFKQLSPFFIGFPAPAVWLKALPTALAVYIIAFGDFVTVQEICRDSERDDEIIDVNVNRSSIICGIRNLVMGLLVPFPQMCGPVSAPYLVSVMARYKEQGKEGMNNVWSGIGSLTIVALIFMLFPLSMDLSAPCSFAMMGVLLLIQGYTCTQVGVKLCRENMDLGIAGMMTGVMVAKGGAWCLGAGIICYLVVVNRQKIVDDYRRTKELQAEEDARLAGRHAAAVSGQSPGPDP